MLGSDGETLATEFLLQRGYQILQRNYRKLSAEVDIIALFEGVIHIIEVKSRSRSYESALKAFDAKKRARLIKAAEEYIAMEGLDCELSLDLIVVMIPPRSSLSGTPHIEHFEALQY